MKAKGARARFYASKIPLWGFAKAEKDTMGGRSAHGIIAAGKNVLHGGPGGRFGAMWATTSNAFGDSELAKKSDRKSTEMLVYVELCRIAVKTRMPTWLYVRFSDATNRWHRNSLEAQRAPMY